MSDTTYINPYSPKSFKKWKTIPTDELPLIRPPKRHMLAQLTGGLKQLFLEVKKSETKKHRPHSSLSRSTGSPSPPIFPILSPGVVNSSSVKRDITITLKRDDEGGGGTDRIGQPSETEESSPYTDNDGVFCPDSTITLLASRYKFEEVLARGQSAIIVKALDTFNGNKAIAIKVLHKVYQPIGSQEADILLEIHRADPWLHVPFARLQNQFIYGPHYCLVFEYLSPTPLYIHYGQNSIKGPSSITKIRTLCLKLLSVLGFLHKQNVIHADLKPENILLRDEKDMSSIVVVDFGNALRNTEEELTLYYSDFELQTLLYRAPEVIFGLHFSLPIDLWSLGCLLAECYSGQPLFLGKTKQELLSKITKLLGPFPKAFLEGECAKNFKQFVGKPFSAELRVENLQKRLDCKNRNFIQLLEKMLIYEPEKRITPFEAASHHFVAEVHPFLYMTSSGDARYPKILVTEDTYTNFPKQDQYNESAQALLKHSTMRKDTSSSSVMQGANVSSSMNSMSFADSDTVKSTVKPPKADSPINSPESTTSHLADPAKSKEPKEKASITSPNVDATLGTDQNSSSKTEEPVEPTRKDFKKTLKSMGLKCEDFTISVYSNEQAHDMLRKQGVEVTNHSSKVKTVKSPIKSIPSRPFQNIGKPSADANNSEAGSPKPDDSTKEEDDDCILLEPPEGTKAPPLPPKRYQQQYQLLGTTVLVNRCGKRPLPDLTSITSKRTKLSKDDAKSEASVEDTLKRLKNYNISITCRKNLGNGSNPVDSSMKKDEDPPENGDADLARFLECQLNEEAGPMDVSNESNKGNACDESQPENILKSPAKEIPPKEPTTSEDQPADTNVPTEPKSSKPSAGITSPQAEQPKPMSPKETNETEKDVFSGIFESIEESFSNKSVPPPPTEVDSSSVFADEEPELEDPKNAPSVPEEEINEELEQELLKLGNLDEKYKEDLPDECVGI